MVLAAVKVVTATGMALQSVDGAAHRLKRYVVAIEDDIGWLAHGIKSSDIGVTHGLACESMGG